MKIMSTQYITLICYSSQIPSSKTIEIGKKVPAKINGIETTVDVFEIHPLLYGSIDVFYNNEKITININDVIEGFHLDKDKTHYNIVKQYMLYNDSGDMLINGDKCAVYKPSIDVYRGTCNMVEYHGTIAKIESDRISILLDKVNCMITIYGLEIDNYIIKKDLSNTIEG